jgi:hypothetical protein
MGDSAEIGALIDSNPDYIRECERVGRTVKGWRIVKATEADIERFERQWA